MDTTCASLKRIRDRVVVPHSIPGLVTKRILTMTYLQGVPLTKLEDHLTDIPHYQRKVAFQKVCAHGRPYAVCSPTHNSFSFALHWRLWYIYGLQCCLAVQIISHASEAYGRMILETGLFQADGHPGNMLAMKGGVVGLIDYGQSKQITDKERWQFARLVVALAEYASLLEHYPKALHVFMTACTRCWDLTFNYSTFQIRWMQRQGDRHHLRSRRHGN